MTLITEADVEAEVASGRSSIVVPRGALVTPQACDRARELSVSLVPGAEASGTVPSPPSVTGMPLGGHGITPETEGYSHPVHAPLYFPRMGQRSLWSKYLNVEFRADPAIVSQFVPEPLELIDDRVTVTVTDHYQPGHGLPIQASSVSVAVRYNGIDGTSAIFLMAHSDEDVCAAREELGRPSILGSIRLWAKGNTWWGVARRGDSEIIRISVFPERVVPPDPTSRSGNPRPLIQYKRIPSADPTRKPWRQIIAIDAELSSVVYEHSIGRGSIEFGISPWGLHRIKPLEPIRGSYRHFAGTSLKSVRCLWEDRPDPIG